MPDEHGFINSVFELPWFMEVAAQSAAYLEKLYDFDPNLVSAWYREHRAAELAAERPEDVSSL